MLVVLVETSVTGSLPSDVTATSNAIRGIIDIRRVSRMTDKNNIFDAGNALDTIHRTARFALAGFDAVDYNSPIFEVGTTVSNRLLC